MRTCPICDDTGVEDTTSTLNKNVRTSRPCKRCEELGVRDLVSVNGSAMTDVRHREMANLAMSMPPDYLRAPDGRSVGIIDWKPISLVNKEIEVEVSALVKSPNRHDQTHCAHYLESGDGRFFQILEWHQVETRARGWGEPTVWFRARVLVPSGEESPTF